ncbi:MAG: cytochrome c family protein [Vicinamibacteraceae bacterium]|nr:cytochrome c family protein [Vicinamibacteraceae bacterium]
MTGRLVTILLVTAIALTGSLLVARARSVHLPGNHQGYEPVQPIAYSHRLHAGDLQVPCLYCHSNAERGRYAGVPPASVCMNCHRFVTAPLGAILAEDEAAAREKRPRRAIVSAELRKLYDALALDVALRPDPARTPQPIAWTRVHNLPDFVYFDHRPHVAAGVTCQTCHGPVETMERVRQVGDLSMGWCVNCHRDAARDGIGGRAVQPSIDCSTCHY